MEYFIKNENKTELFGITNSEDLCVEIDDKNYYIKDLFEKYNGWDVQIIFTSEERI